MCRGTATSRGIDVCARRLLGLQSGGLLIEIALLPEVRGRSSCGLVGLDRARTVACHLQEMAADRVEAPIGVDSVVVP